MHENELDGLKAFALVILGKENVANGMDYEIFKRCILSIRGNHIHRVLDIYYLRYIKGLKTGAIAEQLGISYGIVRDTEAKVWNRITKAVYHTQYLHKPYVEYPKRVGDEWVYDE